MKTKRTNSWIFVIFVIIIIIIIGIIIAVVIFRRDDTGKKCTKNSDCSSGFFCGGNGTCVRGTGGKINSTCTTNDNCEFGLSCVGGKCLPPQVSSTTTSTSNQTVSNNNKISPPSSSISTLPPSSSISTLTVSSLSRKLNERSNCNSCSLDTKSRSITFTDKLITVSSKDETFFLTIPMKDSGTTRSIWSTETRQVFSFSNNTLRVSNISGKRLTKRVVTINEDGTLSLRGETSHLNIVSNGKDLFIKDYNGNRLSIGVSDNFPLATFDCPDYSIDDNLESIVVGFQLISY